MEKRVPRSKNTKGINKLSYFHIERIFNFLNLQEILSCMKLNKYIQSTVIQLLCLAKYKTILKDYKKNKNNFQTKELIKSDAKLIKSYTKKLKLTPQEALIIFPGFILQDLILSNDKASDDKKKNQILLQESSSWRNQQR